MGTVPSSEDGLATPKAQSSHPFTVRSWGTQRGQSQE